MKSESRVGLHPENLDVEEHPSFIDNRIEKTVKVKKKIITYRKKNYGKNLKYR
jgi:hypothetical protein